MLIKPKPPVDQTFTGEETYTGDDVDIVFQWAQEGRPLDADEFYVVGIQHAAGPRYRWAGHETTYRSPATQNGSLRWLIDFADQVGRLYWKVLIVRSKTPKAIVRVRVGRMEEFHPTSII